MLYDKNLSTNRFWYFCLGSNKIYLREEYNKDPSLLYCFTLRSTEIEGIIKEYTIEPPVFSSYRCITVQDSPDHEKILKNSKCVDSQILF